MDKKDCVARGWQLLNILEYMILPMIVYDDGYKSKQPSSYSLRSVAEPRGMQSREFPVISIDKYAKSHNSHPSQLPSLFPLYEACRSFLYNRHHKNSYI